MPLPVARRHLSAKIGEATRNRAADEHVIGGVDGIAKKQKAREGKRVERA